MFSLCRLASTTFVAWLYRFVFAAGILAGGFLLYAGRGRWPDLLIDYGRELYIPWRLSEGDVLYRDILHYYGPLGQYVNALLFRAFGVRVEVLSFFGIFIVVLLAFLIYRLLRTFTDRLAAVSAVAFFLVVHAAGQYFVTGNYNFVAPYSHDLVDGIVLAFAGLCAGAAYLKKPSRMSAIVSGVCLGGVLLTKIEAAVALWGCFMVALVLLCFIGRDHVRVLRRHMAALLVGILALPLAFYLYFALALGWGKAWQVLCSPYVLSFTSGMATNVFTQRVMGVDALAANSAAMFTMAGVWVLAGLLVLAAAWVSARLAFLRPAWMVRSVVLLAVAGVMWFLWARVPVNDVFRPLPLVCVVSGLLGLFRWWRSVSLRERLRAVMSVVVAAFALLMLAKSMFHATVMHYGFALAMPAVMLAVVLWVDELPRLAGHMSADMDTARGVAVILLVGVAASFMTISLRAYGWKTFEVKSTAGSLVTYAPTMYSIGPHVRLVVDHLRANTASGSTLAVISEGVTINFLAQRRNPTPYIEFAPTVIAMEGEEKMIRVFDAAPPDNIVILERDHTEQGARYFGQDYAPMFAVWINEHYVPAFQTGPVPLRGKGFGATVLKRR